MTANARKESPADGKFGTFGGVFTPNLLTILGVIMFLRTGWVVGNAGLNGALVILCIANAITLLTALSLSAISTNLKVGGGGAYFLVSRNLGLEIGGAIGVPLFLAQAISVAFYIVGFTESLQFLWPGLDARLVSTVVLAALFVVAWIGADLAIKAQYFIMAALLFSLVSFFFGFRLISEWRVNLAPAYIEGQNFWSVFAIFFPAVTGIISGVSMSGDLRDPSRSIPRGTLAAVVVAFVIYAAQMCWLAMSTGRAELLGDALVMKQIAVVPAAIFIGLWAATLSSALASLLAAPRTLQAIANDGVAPRFLGRGRGPRNEPRMALVLSAIIAELCLLAGDLNLIAPVITMFFLTNYGTLNLAAGLERWARNPSYRPTFRVHWLVSMAGAAGCLFVMILLNALATAAAVVLIAALYSLLTRRRYRTQWGDVRQGFWFAVTRLGLLKLSSARAHVRNWRPVILVLSGNPKSRLRMVQYAHAFESGRGLLFLAQVVTGEWEKLVPLQVKLQKSLEEFIHENRLSAVGQTIMADDFEHGVFTLLQASGVGPFNPNTVLTGWSEDAVRQPAFARAVRRILEIQKNLIVFSEAEEGVELDRCIDVWWHAKENGSFMLTLAHLLNAGGLWRNHTIRLLRIITDEAGREQTTEAADVLLRGARIEGKSELIVSSEPPLETIARTSANSDVVFIGISLQSIEERENPLDVYAPMVGKCRGNVFLTKSWHDLEL